MKQNREIDIECLEQLLKNQTSKIVLFQSFHLLKPKKGHRVSFFLIIIACILPAILIGISSDTITLAKEAVEIINQIIIALFGIIFTGYALFQALLNKELLLWMLECDTDKIQKIKKSRLQITNEYFVQIMLLQGISIFIGLFVGLMLSAVSTDWCLFDNNIINTILAFIALWIYFCFNFLIVWELKSFIFNLFQLFNAHAVSRVLSLLNGDEDQE